MYHCPLHVLLSFLLLWPPGVCTCQAGACADPHDETTYEKAEEFPCDHDEDGDDHAPACQHDVTVLNHGHRHDKDHAPNCPHVRARLLPANLTPPVKLPPSDGVVQTLADRSIPFVAPSSTGITSASPRIAPARDLYLILRALLL